MVRLLFLLPLILPFLFFSEKGHAVANTVGINPDTPRMKQYYLVMLLKGPNRNHDKETSAKIQAAHLTNIDSLASTGAIVMAGPMGYDRDLRGLFIMDAKDSAAAAALVNTDPAVKAGRLRFEIHPWWTQTGIYTFK